MYDDKNVEIINETLLLVYMLKKALKEGTLHYRKSDGELLQTETEIIQALLDEGVVIFKPIKKKLRD